MRNYSGGPKWISAVVESCTRPLSYKTALGQEQTVKWYVDQIITHSSDEMLDTVPITVNVHEEKTSAVPNSDQVIVPEEQEMSISEKESVKEVPVVLKETTQLSTGERDVSLVT